MRAIDPSIGCSVPFALFSAMESPSLLPGESLEEYRSIQELIVQEIMPQSPLEWLWVADLIDLSWEILRYRRLRDEILKISRETAIRSLLEKIDLVGIPTQHLPTAQIRTKENAYLWRTDPSAAREIESRLAEHALDTTAINLEVYVQAQELFLTFDALLNAAQSRRIVLLREIENRRMGRQRFASRLPSASSHRHRAKRDD